MCDYLKQHPDVFIPEKKELYFFGADLQVFNRPRITQAEYLAYFAPANRERRLGEGSVWYLYSRQAATELKAFCPTAWIIIMLRNPVDMMYALYSQHLYTGNEDIEDFATALQAEEARKQGLRLPKSRTMAGDLLYRDAARYTQQVQRYVDVFGWEQVHVVLFDDFVRDTARVYRNTCAFLDVDAGFQPAFRIINPNKRVRSRLLLYLLKSPSPTMQNLGEILLPDAIRRRVRWRLKRYNTRYESRAPMHQELRRRLQAEFVPEVEALSLLLKRDVTHWCRT
jgi:hypothetical protein